LLGSNHPFPTLAVEFLANFCRSLLQLSLVFLIHGDYIHMHKLDAVQDLGDLWFLLLDETDHQADDVAANIDLDEFPSGVGWRELSEVHLAGRRTICVGPA